MENSLMKFYGKDDVYTTGNPVFSFFDKRSECFNYWKYVDAVNKNRIARHTNFSTVNFKHEVDDVKSNYTFDLNEILGKFDLIGAIFIYFFSTEEKFNC